MTQLGWKSNAQTSGPLILDQAVKLGVLTHYLPTGRASSVSRPMVSCSVSRGLRLRHVLKLGQYDGGREGRDLGYPDLAN